MFISCPALFYNEKVAMFDELGISTKHDFDNRNIWLNTKNIASIFPSRDGACWLQSLNGSILPTSATFEQIIEKCDGFLVTRGHMQKHIVRSITLSKDEEPEFMKDIDPDLIRPVGGLDNMGLSVDDIDSVETEEVVLDEPEDSNPIKFEDIKDWKDIDDQQILELPMAFNIEKIQSITPTRKGNAFIQMVIHYISCGTTLKYEDVQLALEKSYKANR